MLKALFKHRISIKSFAKVNHMVNREINVSILLAGILLAVYRGRGKMKKRNFAFTTAAKQRGSHKSAETYKASGERPGQSNELITLVSGWSQEMRLKWLNRPTISRVMLRE